MTSDAAVADLHERLGETEIDVLINNAAIALRITLQHLDFNSIREQFEVNALGALRGTRNLSPFVRPCTRDLWHQQISSV